jgi:hypothetical protein
MYLAAIVIESQSVEWNDQSLGFDCNRSPIRPQLITGRGEANLRTVPS